MKEETLMSSNKKSEVKAIIASIVMTSMIFTIRVLLRTLYVDVDNFFISLVTNGLYDNENYCKYLHPLLCYIIKGISRLFPLADAYLLLAHFLVWLETVWLMFLSMTSKHGKMQRIAYCGLIMFGTVAIDLFRANFTIQAASFVFTGCLTHFLYYNKKKKSIYLVLSGVFIVIGFMWRVQAALIFVPFIVLELLSIIYETKVLKGKFCKSFWLHSCILFNICIVLLISHYLFDVSAKYKEATEYNSARTILEDFPVLDWKDIENELTGIDELDFEGAKDWFLTDTERISTDTLMRMATVAKTTKYPFNLFGICMACIDIVRSAINYTKILWLTLLMTNMCFLYILISSISKHRKIESALAMLGGFIILMYFTVLGRAFLRIWYPIIYAVLFVIIIQLSKVPVEDKNSKAHVIFYAVMAVLSISSIVFILIKHNLVNPNTALLARLEQYDERYAKTCLDDNYYFWEDWHKDVATYYMKLGKLPSLEFLDHNFDDGGWVYGQNYFNNNLADAGITNPVTALLESDNTYYVSDDNLFMLKYMRKFYGADIETVQVDELDGIPIWQFYHREKAK